MAGWVGLRACKKRLRCGAEVHACWNPGMCKNMSEACDSPRSCKRRGAVRQEISVIVGASKTCRTREPWQAHDNGTRRRCGLPQQLEHPCGFPKGCRRCGASALDREQRRFRSGRVDDARVLPRQRWVPSDRCFRTSTKMQRRSAFDMLGQVPLGQYRES